MNENVLNEQVKNAPMEIKELLTKKDWSIIVNQIAQKNNLIADQKVSFENEVLFVLLGMELITNFQKNVTENVGVDESTSINMSEEVYNKIFKKVELFLPEREEILTETNLPEIAPEIHPMVEEGEVVHDAPPLNLKTEAPITKPVSTNIEDTLQKTSGEAMSTRVDNQRPEMPSPAPKINHYAGGKDPYREPIE